MDNETVGKRIKKWRKLKKMTQEQLARKIEMNVKSIQRYETGTNPIPIDVLNNIAIALNIGIDKLIYEKNSITGDFNEYRYDAFIKMLLSLGYTIEDIPLYKGGFDSDGVPIDNWETALILRKDKKVLQLNLDDIETLFDNIENYINFTIHNLSDSEEFEEETIEQKVENNIDEYYTDEYIEKIKEKIGYYGDEYIKPLNTAEKIVWEKWKENNKVIDNEK